MELPLTSATVPLVVLDSAASTNDEVRARAVGAPDLLTVITTDQRQGRGRMRREWSTPPGRGLAASVLVRLRDGEGRLLDQDSWGWIPLLAGAAMTVAVRSVSADRIAELKWPNDVLIGGRKVSGILTEVLPGGDVIVGAGVNISVPVDQLPTSASTSLTIEGTRLDGDELIDALLSGWLRELRRMRDALVICGAADASGVRAEVVALCGSIGRVVEVQLPDGGGFRGRGIGLDATGRLQVRRDPTSDDGGDSGDVVESVAAGDVLHLR